MSKIIAMIPKEDTAAWRRMARAIRYLSEHYREQPRLEDAAAAVGLSAFHFQREFSRYVGVSPKSFVGQLTLDRAQRALDDGASVLDAAFDAGLSGPSRLHDLSLKIEAMTPGDYAKGGAGLTIRYGFHPSPFGSAVVLMTDKGVCGLAFSDEGEEDAAFADMQERWPKASYARDDARAGAVVERIFGDKAAVLKLHLMGTPFQVKVWQALLAIPPGRFDTYGAIARRLESASRAVGSAVGRNPISWLIPCHRVLGKSGALTGYHWGLTRKRAMLAVEAAQSDNPRTSAIA
ncbi:MAG: bifunctional helix-turn-helix domain-containing protein/methylated-DNA--[protein]-cysteine S-methyltransferase [Alphaproteobacteria bacterium]|nr:bifunctional helix-turn-helix domain-containing protein/methylated-DNA--[protein]-cysteine S-methyltransferase [Alphaproteobacteria bacterium]